MKIRFVLLLFGFGLFLGTVNCAGVRSNPRFNDGDSTMTLAEGFEGRFYTSNENLSLDKVRLIEEIKSYLGVPYLWGGDTRAGMDCSGFVSTVYRKALGLELPHNTKMMYRLGESVDKNKLRFGDLVFFKNIEYSGVSHVGIYLGKNYFAHASTSKGVTISNLSEKYYRKRYVSAKRISEPFFSGEDDVTN
jgi:cell wall-associated NlpC family hydrolase